MALYFAMIDGERRGPFTLDALHEAGVTPDTYVWSKGMSDWEQAADVADICRYYRQRIFDKLHPVPIVAEQPAVPEAEETREAGDGGYPFPMPQDDPEEIDHAPVSLLTVSILLTLLCFPPTGFVAIYYSVMSRKAWDQYLRGESRQGKDLYSADEKMGYRRAAHDCARNAKKWVGITFFLGMILYAFLVNMNSSF